MCALCDAVGCAGDCDCDSDCDCDAETPDIFDLIFHFVRAAGARKIWDILAKATRYAVRKGSDCQKTRISFKLQHVQAPYTQSHMPKEAIYFGFRFRWFV